MPLFKHPSTHFFDYLPLGGIIPHLRKNNAKNKDTVVGLLYIDLQNPSYPAEVNHFFKIYEKDIEQIIDWLRKEDDNWDTVANTRLCNIANEYGKLDEEKMIIIGKVINRIAYERF